MREVKFPLFFCDMFGSSKYLPFLCNMKTKVRKQPTDKQLNQYPQLKNWTGIYTTLSEAIINIKGGIDPDLPF